VSRRYFSLLDHLLDGPFHSRLDIGCGWGLVPRKNGLILKYHRIGIGPPDIDSNDTRRELGRHRELCMSDLVTESIRMEEEDNERHGEAVSNTCTNSSATFVARQEVFRIVDAGIRENLAITGEKSRAWRLWSVVCLSHANLHVIETHASCPLNRLDQQQQPFGP
jgi:hypothetical protein